ncbi:hypothetical protein NQ315_016484 [Exocentrus adspersus]|uniref:Reverse transcriptase domain-containing protein n=1 Tax=Exocentrus adspersus TaxID=1586481 RepID=A0AAV8W0J1_9CUCU|nr:hypothetical protein NQ315_016484 [Exocentrus adspersus]
MLRNSPLHPLARFLLNIISPLEGNTLSAVKNTQHFVRIIKEQHVTQQDLLVSFDVTSLFTNVPTNKALDVVKKKLSEDESLEHRTSLSLNAIMEMLNMCINTTYFQLDDEFYQQEFGVAMGPITSTQRYIHGRL